MGFLVFCLIMRINEGVNAQSSKNFKINKYSFSQGGSSSESDNYRVLDAIGASAASGQVSSENYLLFAGFLGAGQSVLMHVGNGEGIKLPHVFKLHQNYPNPFNPITHIEYQLPVPSEISLIIYDIQGQLVRRLVMGTVPAGYHKAIWKNKNDYGRGVTSGMYFYRIYVKPQNNQQKPFISVKKMILMK